MGATKQERLQAFLVRLNALPPAATGDEAFQLVADCLNAVEDEMTDIPFDPTAWQNDGRMYPPQQDARRAVEGRVDLIRYRSKGHNTWIGASGAIQIVGLDGVVLLDKAGADGLMVTI